DYYCMLYMGGGILF
nr:immunoglobulin light chain junction region [Macaca mulatta]